MIKKISDRICYRISFHHPSDVLVPMHHYKPNITYLSLRCVAQTIMMVADVLAPNSTRPSVTTILTVLWLLEMIVHINHIMQHVYHIAAINSLVPGRFQFNLRQVIFKLSLVNGAWDISYEIALRWMPLDLKNTCASHSSDMVCLLWGFWKKKWLS